MNKIFTNQLLLNLLYSSRTISALGFHLFSLYSILYAFSWSPKLSTMGFLGLSGFLGNSLTSLIAGSLADKIKRKGIYLLIIHLLILILSFTIITLMDHGELTSNLYFFVFFMTTLRSLRSPVYFSLSHSLIAKSKNQLTSSKFYSVSWQVAGVLGPLIGGILTLKFQESILMSAFMICLLSSTLLILPFLQEKNTELKPSALTPQESGKFFQNYFEGLKQSWNFFIKDRIIRESFLLDTLGVLFASVTAFLPFLLEGIGESPALIGPLKAIQSLGGLLASLFITKDLLENYTGKIFTLSLIAFAVCTLFIPFLENMNSFYIFFLLLGLFDGVSILVRDLLLLIKVPTPIMGKVYAMNSVFITSSDDLGEFESGVVGSWMGTAEAVFFGAAVCLLMTIMINMRSTELWNFRFSRMRSFKVNDLAF